jgi:hypothetical protein
VIPVTENTSTTTIAELYTPTGQFAPHHTLATLAAARFEIERMVAYESGHAMPYVWASNVEPAELARTH